MNETLLIPHGKFTSSCHFSRQREGKGSGMVGERWEKGVKKEKGKHKGEGRDKKKTLRLLSIGEYSVGLEKNISAA